MGVGVGMAMLISQREHSFSSLLQCRFCAAPFVFGCNVDTLRTAQRSEVKSLNQTRFLLLSFFFLSQDLGSSVVEA